MGGGQRQSAVGTKTLPSTPDYCRLLLPTATAAADCYRQRQSDMFFYYFGRGLQLIGMWLLLVDLFTAGPLGPNPRLFALGIAVFILGWWLGRFRRSS